ncbi:MAG: DUF1573 domain-containing protein [Fuerstiella sp.]
MKNLILMVVFFAILVGAGFWLSEGDDAAADGDLNNGAGTATPVVEIDEEERERPQPSETGPWPKVVIEESDYDFGSMLVGAKMDHTFVIKNEGAADLELQAGQATCKCTKFDLSRTRVPPGESAELVVQWVGKFKDMSFEHGGPIYTNDPKSREIAIRVSGIVDEAVEMSPESWHMEIESGDAGETTGFVYSRVHRDFQITELTADSEFVQVTAEPLDADTIDQIDTQSGVVTAYKLLVSVSPDAPPGLMNTDVTVQLDCIQDPMKIPLTVQKAGPIKILPPPGTIWSSAKNGLVLGRFSRLKGREASLSLLVDEAGMDGPLEFTSITTDPSYITAEVGEGTTVAEAKRRYPLSIKIPSGLPPVSRDTKNPGTITIETNHPSGQKVLIRLSYTAF